MGRGCLLQYSLAYHPHSIQFLMILHKVGSHDDFCGFQEINSDCVDTKLRGIKATCIGSYTGKTSAIANEATCSDFVCMCL